MIRNYNESTFNGTLKLIKLSFKPCFIPLKVAVAIKYITYVLYVIF